MVSEFRLAEASSLKKLGRHLRVLPEQFAPEVAAVPDQLIISKVLVSVAQIFSRFDQILLALQRNACILRLPRP
jgi:hypothetical protein